MDSLDLIREFLEENGVRCRRPAEDILRLPLSTRLISRDLVIYAIRLPNHESATRKKFDLHHPDSLQGILEWFHGQLRRRRQLRLSNCVSE
jgi:hypothetical protein